MKTKFCKIFLLLATLSTVSGCGYSLGKFSSNNSDFDKNGSIVTARAIPDVRTPETNMLGFLPQQTDAQVKIVIDRNAKALILLNRDERVLTTQTFEGLERLHAGKYQVMHKQRNALWHAPDNYFQTRDLQTPDEGSQERFRRGALGEFAIFIDADTPLHNGPVWSPQIGGLKIEDDVLAKLYYSVEVGTPVEIR
ncbi:MAG: L,D-transpeptidase [Bdellovibrionales bacterium]|nr:L,D-transpeptidase [Bdellovibrionales bacterium]